MSRNRYFVHYEAIPENVADYWGTIGIDVSFIFDEPVNDAMLIDSCRSDASIRVDHITQKKLLYIEGSYHFMGLESLDK